jgi:protein subunit release factor B
MKNANYFKYFTKTRIEIQTQRERERERERERKREIKTLKRIRNMELDLPRQIHTDV